MRGASKPRVLTSPLGLGFGTPLIFILHISTRLIRLKRSLPLQCSVAHHADGFNNRALTCVFSLFWCFHRLFFFLFFSLTSLFFDLINSHAQRLIDIVYQVESASSRRIRRHRSKMVDMEGCGLTFEDIKKELVQLKKQFYPGGGSCDCLVIIIGSTS